jgi:DNA-binding NtrC family response regulator
MMHRHNVLVVEDDSVLSDLICETLIDIGLNPIVAPTADEGRALFAQSHHQLNLVLTDITTPGQSTGEDLAWDAYRLAPHIPVLVCSGYLGTQHTSLPPGVHVLPKPWTLHVFEEKISCLIRKI